MSEDALAHYMATFDGPLPQPAIAALSALFHFQAPLSVEVDDALIEHEGATDFVLNERTVAVQASA